MSTYKGYIYCITNRVNGKQYVGQTNTTVKRRYAEHIRCAKSDGVTKSLLYLAMRKYGVDNFSVETLESVEADTRENIKSILNEREIANVANLNTYKPNGYNMTAGGYAFADHVTRCVYQVDSDGNVVGLYDSIADAEYRNQLPVGSIKRALPSSTHQANGWHWYYADTADFTLGDNIGLQTTQRKSVYRFALDGTSLGEYDSITQAEQSLGCSHGKISEACMGKRLSAFGFLWSYTTTPPLYQSTQKTHKCKSVVRLTMDGERVDEFPSATAAAEQLGLQSSLISACCIGKRKSTGGYRWAFVI